VERGPEARPLLPPLLLRGGTILTLDSAASVHPGTDLLLENGRIAALGKSLALPAGGRSLDVSDHLVLPGLVQGHIHLGQTLFRGLAEGRPLLAWLRERIWPLESAHDDETAYSSGRLGAAECLLGGTTAIQEIGLGRGIEGLLAAIADSGLRATAGKCLMDSGEGMPEGLREDASSGLAHAVEVGERFERQGNGRLHAVLNPRFALSCSDGLWQEVARVAGERGWPVHTHALEQRAEGRAVRREKQGRDEIEYFSDLGLLDRDLRIAHGVWLRPRHLPRLAGRRFGVVHCPGSNLKLGSGLAPVAWLRRAGIPVGIGADGAACNNRLDGWAELRLAAQIASVRSGPGSLSGLEALRLATHEGARVLGLEAEIGSLEVGKRADVTVLRTDLPELSGAGSIDLHDLVAFGASPAAVRHVMVDGELLVEDGTLTRWNLRQILESARNSTAKLLARAKL
jgi:5-methylthioadenosine/S-adenosylhomocysteine deaminase